MEEDIKLYNDFILGKNESFEKIIDKYKEKLIYFIQRFVKSIDIAEDISQDVFVYMLINKKEYDFKYSLKTYLYTIGKSRALNYLKRESKILPIDESNLYDDDLEEKIFYKERTTNLKKAINKLSSKYQLAIYLVDVEELQYKDICKILNKSLPQVKMLIHRARKKLKYILSQEVNKYEE